MNDLEERVEIRLPNDLTELTRTWGLQVDAAKLKTILTPNYVAQHGYVRDSVDVRGTMFEGIIREKRRKIGVGDILIFTEGINYEEGKEIYSELRIVSQQDAQDYRNDTSPLGIIIPSPFK